MHHCAESGDIYRTSEETGSTDLVIRALTVTSVRFFSFLVGGLTL